MALSPLEIKKPTLLLLGCLLLGLGGSHRARARHPAAEWSFAVSGDSRNCGDIVMPAIAAGVHKDNAAFYLHLGDLRAIAAPDGDYLHEPEHRSPQPSKEQYLQEAWDDFIHSQIEPFGKTPFYVGIGNHETAPPKTRDQFVAQFTRWLDSPTLHKQRLAGDSKDQQVRAYFHWIQGGVDFIYLDNATPDQFDAAQVAWFEAVLHRAASDSKVHSVVVGMHAALPDSIASGHSMSDYPAAVTSGRQVYSGLLKFNQETGKHVYLLASHSHFYMSGIFDTDYWRANGGVLPGWIVGTGGAIRYPLPPGSEHAKEAREKVYGYLLGTVHPDGSIDFKFQEVKRDDVPEAVAQRFTPEFTDYCFNENVDLRIRVEEHLRP